MSEFHFSYNPKHAKTQLILLFVWSSLGLVLIYLSPFFFVSYIIPVLGFSAFFYLCFHYYRGCCLQYKDHWLIFGTFYKTKINLRDVRRIKKINQDYLLKTEQKTFTLKTAPIHPKHHYALHEFFCNTAWLTMLFFLEKTFWVTLKFS